MKLPPLENLRIFEAVARLRGFTAAAESLALSHSAVSRRVSELEARIGVQLLHRSSRQVTLTPAGKILFEAAQDALRTIHEATAEIARAGRRPPLLVSCERSLAMRWLIPRLSGFQDANPDIQVFLSTGGGPIDLQRERIDVAIRRADFTPDPGMHSLPLFPEYIGAVMAPGMPPAGRHGLTRLHTTGRPDAWTRWLRLAKTASIAPVKWRDQYFDHFFLSLQAAEAGLGIAIGPLFMVADSLTAERLVAPSGFVADGTRYVALLRTPPAPESQAARFTGWLQSAAAQLLAQTEAHQRTMTGTPNR